MSCTIIGGCLLGISYLWKTLGFYIYLACETPLPLRYQAENTCKVEVRRVFTNNLFFYSCLGITCATHLRWPVVPLRHHSGDPQLVWSQDLDNCIVIIGNCRGLESIVFEKQYLHFLSQFSFTSWNLYMFGNYWQCLRYVVLFWKLVL